MRKTSSKLPKPPAQTKADKILKLLQRNTGATITELAKATGWQRHSIHGFLSGILKKKRELQIKITKKENKDRRYFVEGNVE